MPAADQFLRAVDASRHWLLAAAALLLLASFSPYWRITPDSALFLGVARNLALGQGFTFNEQTVTSINAGFPYLLAAIRPLASDPIIASNVLMLALGLVSLAFVYLLMLRNAGRPLAVLVTLLTAVNGTFLRHSCEILADIPFFFCSTLALLGYELTFAIVKPKQPTNSPTDPRLAGDSKVQNPARNPAFIFLAGLLVLLGLAGMASLRIVVLGPLAAILVDLLWRIRRSRFKWAVIAGASGVLLVALAIRLADPRMAGGFKLLGKERELLEMFQNLPAMASRIATFTASELFTEVTPRAIFGNKIGLWPLDVLVSLAVIAAGGMLFRRRLAWGLLVAIYFVQWLLIFPDTRYFLPILPLLILGWWDLAVRLSMQTSPRWQRPILITLVALIAVPNAVRSIGFAIEQHKRPFEARYLRGRFQDLPEFAARIREALPADAIVLTSGQFAGPLHYFSGVRTIPTVGATLPIPLPPGRPIFVLLPGEAELDPALTSLGFARSSEIISGPPRGKGTLSLLSTRPLP
ncbi:MAG: hypothetical protein JNK16_05295 [Phycisphaerales bacterium]|nr:hypothetical protein [Phycisphaerales bacterium]